jgi:hypothetical protein
MPNITLTVSEELRRKMRAHPDVKWSEVVRRIIAQRIQDLERVDAIARRSRLLPEDIDELDHLVKEGLRRRYERLSRHSSEG